LKRLAEFVADVKRFPDKYGKWSKLSVGRFKSDIEKSKAADYPFEFRPAAAARVIGFIEKLKQSKGKWARRDLTLSPFQVFIIANLFGWVKKADGLRRFRNAYVSLARKNGKSTLISGLADYMVLADPEPSAEIYLAANARHQADIVFQQCKETITITPGLSRHLRCQTFSIVNPKTFGVIKKLSSEANTLDGLNASFVVLDEVHSFRNSKLYDVLRGSMGARSQPLMVSITTAGNDKSNFGYQQELYTKQVLDGMVEDDTYFGIIFAIDDDDDPSDESLWIKANPGLGEMVSIEDLRSQYRESKSLPQKMNDFIAKRLNRYVDSKTGWIDGDFWRSCVGDATEAELVGQPCFVAIDLSKRGDFTAVSLTFPTVGFYTKWFYYLPEEGFAERVEFENAQYLQWVKDGFLKLTPGRVIDYAIVEADIRQAAKDYKIIEAPYDPYAKSKLIDSLEADGVPCIEFPQRIQYVGPAATALEVAVKSRAVKFQNNPISLWMMANAEAFEDVNGNLKIQKGDDRRKRIDGVITLIMGHHRARLWAGEPVENPDAVKEIIFI
jgi:phage terminase large subunit-like protein